MLITARNTTAAARRRQHVQPLAGPPGAHGGNVHDRPRLLHRQRGAALDPVRLHAGASALEWVVAGYGLTFSAFLITAGRLGDQHRPAADVLPSGWPSSPSPRPPAAWPRPPALLVRPGCSRAPPPPSSDRPSWPSSGSPSPAPTGSGPSASTASSWAWPPPAASSSAGLLIQADIAGLGLARRLPDQRPDRRRPPWPSPAQAGPRVPSPRPSRLELDLPAPPADRWPDRHRTAAGRGTATRLAGLDLGLPGGRPGAARRLRRPPARRAPGGWRSRCWTCGCSAPGLSAPGW